ncbi:MAG: pantoate--beta-alanine ligase [Chloroflexi bacterium]|nr:pantoate--beta-alanine ligase [Chloroflexota bacterium]MBK90742.1 pantoate--beta-alanine ligase [Chloroflexota bacterium]
MEKLKIINTISEFIELRNELSKKIALVPTMGSIHEGHISLVETAKKHGDIIIATIFVNPIQFNNTEDYNSYPKDFDKDVEILQKNGVDILFCPSLSEVYPDGFDTTVRVNSLSNSLEGQYRKGHMEGVATIVTKLFNIILPDYAIFGEKDYQQLLLIKSFVKDLNMSVEIIQSKTVRDKEGLALSSRNIKLTSAERLVACEIIKSLNIAFEKIISGQKNSEQIINFIKEYLASFDSIKIEYVSIRNPYDFEIIDKIQEEFVILVAVFIGEVRLIDNVIFVVKNE